MFFFQKYLVFLLKIVILGREKKLEIGLHLLYFDFQKKIMRFLHHIYIKSYHTKKKKSIFSMSLKQ